MNIALIGGAGFIGTNLVIELAKNPDNQIWVIDGKEEFFAPLQNMGLSNVSFMESSFDEQADFEVQVKGQDVIYHLASTNIPGNSNQQISEEINSNVTVTTQLLDACVKEHVKKVVFLSSGGTVYGKVESCPIPEDAPTYPISSYGVQKLTIEKLLYLYHYQFGLDCRVIRLANPYGPYQRPDGRLGVVTTFVHKALTNQVLKVYGDGTVTRDFIYIDDAIRGILNIADGENGTGVFNLGSGQGTSVNQVIETIKAVVNPDLKVEYIAGRASDVPVNYLDIRRYEETFGQLNPIALEEGVRKTAEFLKKQTLL